MTKRAWKAKRRVPFTGCSLLGETWLWTNVERIGAVCFNTIKLQPSYTIYFKSGNTLEIKYDNVISEPILVKAFIGTKVSREVQDYFDSNCPQITRLKKHKDNTQRAFLEYHRNILKETP